ncbi:MAG: hypothetical protein LUD17_05165 [Bacteroidales bacterium]|nr:hypothetical protein [Bacteroidales bacterium]
MRTAVAILVVIVFSIVAMYVGVKVLHWSMKQIIKNNPEIVGTNEKE